MGARSNKHIIDITFALAKNCRLLVSESKTEAHPGHVNWAAEETADRVLDEILNTDIRIVHEKIQSSGIEELRHAFGYAKNARLCFLEGRTEPQGGHLSWAHGQHISLVKYEILDQLEHIKRILVDGFFELNTSRFMVLNKSNRVIWIKPSEGSEPVMIKPTGVYHGTQDGFSDPENRPGEVFKTVDNIDAIVHPNGSVTTTNGTLIESAGQLIIGGWLVTAPDPGWDMIFDKANHPRRAQQARENHEREQREERERRNREYEERLDRYERGERDPGEPPRRRDEFDDPF